MEAKFVCGLTSDTSTNNHMAHTKSLTLSFGFHPILDRARRKTRDVVRDWHPQDAVFKPYTLVDIGRARLLRRAARGYVTQFSSGAAKHLTSAIHQILGLVDGDSKYVIGELGGCAVDVGCIEGVGVQYDEGAVDEQQEKIGERIFVREELMVDYMQNECKNASRGPPTRSLQHDKHRP